ncbi:MAG: exodeoxyribonuclease VII large subunit [Oscillospiraceae bacterium]|jgi:exodeoxyribonuclease VII large subunit
MSETNFVTVSQINEYIKNILSSDENLTGLFIRGEISNFTHHVKSGHFYFTLKDEKTSIKAVMFRGSAQHVRFKPENGMKVVIFGSIRVFERDGLYQLYCEDMQPDGIGALFLAFEQLKRKLEAKGYFDVSHKRPICPVPQKIAVLTAQTGAALQDIINIVSRRYPLVELKILPVLVQGEQAPQSIVQAFAWLNRQNSGYADTVILARGGGSMEDLSAFNTEAVAEAVYHSKIPVISAVGHETDFTIADFVADLRAPTPSAAAELAVPDAKILRDSLDNAENILYNYTLSVYQKYWQKLRQSESMLRSLSPVSLLKQRRLRLEQGKNAVRRAMALKVDALTAEFKRSVGVLEALSPLQVLTRGYSITFAKGRPVTDASQVAVGQKIETKLNSGRLISEVIENNGQS